MNALFGVTAALVILGIGALVMLTAQQLSPPPDHIAGPAYSNVKAARPSAFMTPWPDLNDLPTSVSTAVSVASASAELRSSTLLWHLSRPPKHELRQRTTEAA
jgi:hypothetical protein